jgi:hypothetical protein
MNRMNRIENTTYWSFSALFILQILIFFKDLKHLEIADHESETYYFTFIIILYLNSMVYVTQSQEVEFHEIKIADQIILQVFARSKFLIMIQSPDRSIFHEIKIQKRIIREFQSHDQFVSYEYDHEIKIC